MQGKVRRRTLITTVLMSANNLQVASPLSYVRWNEKTLRMRFVKQTLIPKSMA